jgi:tetratricopeptide (TPR) repeat protein
MQKEILENSFKDKKNHSLFRFLSSILIIILLFLGAYYLFNFLKSGNLNTQIYNESVNLLSQSYENDELDSSIEIAKKLIELKPKDSSNYLLLAILYLEKASVSKDITFINLSESAAQKAIELDSKNENVYRILGQIKQKNNEFDEALEMYNKALEINPRDVLSYEARGNLYKLKYEYGLAEADYKKALEIDRNNARVLIQLADNYIITDKANSDTEILDIYARALEVSKDNQELSRIHIILGVHFFEDENYDFAIDNFTRALEIEGNDEYALGGIAIVNLIYSDLMSEDGNMEAYKLYLDRAEKSIDQVLQNGPKLSFTYEVFDAIKKRKDGKERKEIRIPLIDKNEWMNIPGKISLCNIDSSLSFCLLNK